MKIDIHRIKFITDLVEFDFNRPLELGCGFTLRKANSMEIKYIKEKRLYFYGDYVEHIYETTYIKPEDGGPSWKMHHNESEWRYWVIDIGKSKIEHSDLLFPFPEDSLGYAASLLDCNLFLGFDIIINDSEYFSHPCYPEYHKIQEANPQAKSPILIKLEEIQPFCEYLSLIDNIGTNDYLKNVLDEFFNLNFLIKRIPRGSAPG